jgi:hypothetical protein
MKVIAIVLMVAVAAVCSFPAEEINANDNVEVIAVEAAPVESGVEFIDGLVRDKRQFGGKEDFFWIVKNVSQSQSTIMLTHKKFLLIVYDHALSFRLMRVRRIVLIASYISIKKRRLKTCFSLFQLK